ncbi:MAG: TonB family protein [Hyphomicrobiaceae bacterium]
MTVPPESEAVVPITPSADARWAAAEVASRRPLQAAAAAALALHLLAGAALMGGLDGLLAAMGLPTLAQPKPIGDERGHLDGVAAEIVDAAELKQRYIAFEAGKAEAEAEARRPPAQAEAPQAAAPEEKVEDAKPEPAPEASKPEPAPLAAPLKSTTQADKPKEKPAEKAAEKPAEKPPEKRVAETVMSDAEMRQLVEQTVEDIQSSLVSVSTPGAARLGEASPFVRAVIRTLKANMPRSQGLKGNVLVQLAIGDDGRIAAIRVVRSSGRPELDRLVVERVARTQLTPPPATATPRERVFQITYSYN